jgi:hypothetical protein
MLSLIYLTTPAGKPTSEFLRAAGYGVWEAFSVPEAVWARSQQYAEVLLVDAAFADLDESQFEDRYVTIRLKPAATAKDAMRELASLLSQA